MLGAICRLAQSADCARNLQTGLPVCRLRPHDRSLQTVTSNLQTAISLQIATPSLQTGRRLVGRYLQTDAVCRLRAQSADCAYLSRPQSADWPSLQTGLSQSADWAVAGLSLQTARAQSAD